MQLCTNKYIIYPIYSLCCYQYYVIKGEIRSFIRIESFRMEIYEYWAKYTIA
jgi:hypothetical protein